MEGLRIEAAQSGTAIKPVARGIYEAGKSDAQKTWYIIPHASTKGGGNKGRIYTSTYAPGAYIITKTNDKNKTPTVMMHAGQIN